MVFGLFEQGPLLEDAYAEWMFDTFGWALHNFDARSFRDETILVTPSNKHFPGRANNPDEMAKLIFSQVVGYAGMRHWPLRLLPPDSCVLEQPKELRIEGALRGAHARAPAADESALLNVSYDPQTLNNPEAMIAVYAHTLAHYLGSAVTEPPPGGVDNWPQATELLAVFLGFGLMFANTALVLPSGGCCGGPVVRRQAYVSQHDITYALAIFVALKDMPARQVLPHLKKSLRGHFKKALREVKTLHGKRFQTLRASIDQLP